MLKDSVRLQSWEASGVEGVHRFLRRALCLIDFGETSSLAISLRPC